MHAKQNLFFLLKIRIKGGGYLRVKNRVREIRKKRGITQVQMAKDLKITRQTIHAIETHKYNPSLELALKILDYLDVPLEEIFFLERRDQEDDR